MRLFVIEYVFKFFTWCFRVLFFEFSCYWVFMAEDEVKLNKKQKHGYSSIVKCCQYILNEHLLNEFEQRMLNEHLKLLQGIYVSNVIL